MKSRVLSIVIILSMFLLISGCGSNKEKNTLEGVYVPNINATDEYELLFNTPAILVLFKDGIDFNNDYTCTTAYEYYNCSYKYEEGLYKVIITDSNPGELKFEFKVIDDNTIKDNFDYNWNKTDKKINNDESIDESTENDKSLKMNKDYFIVGTSTGKNAYISFKSDGTCTPNFYSLSNSGSMGNNLGSINVIYQNDNPKCTYTVKENIISVSWLGTFKQTYTYKLGNGKTQTSDYGSFYIMKDIEFIYNEEDDTIDTNNGTWKLSTGESFFTIQFILNGSEDKENNNELNTDKEDNNSNNTTNNDNNSSNNSNNNNNDNESNEVESPNLIEEIKVRISVDDYDRHYFEISNVPYTLKELYINGKSIEEPYYNDSNFIEIEHEGETCVNYKLVGEDGYTREGKECFVFEAKQPTVKLTTWGEKDCYFYLNDLNSWGDSMYYNKLEKLTIKYDGVLIENSPNIRPYDREYIKQGYFGYIYSTAGKHTITFTNKFGKVQTEELEFAESCGSSFAE